MGQVFKVSRVNGTVVELSNGQSVSTNDDFFKEGQLVFLLQQNSVVGDKLRGTMRLRYDSYSKIAGGMYRLTKNVAVRTSILVPLHIKDRATGQFHVPAETSEFDFLSLLGVESPEVAESKYDFDAAPEVTEPTDPYADKVNPDRSFVSDDELFGGGSGPAGGVTVVVASVDDMSGVDTQPEHGLSEGDN